MAAWLQGALDVTYVENVVADIAAHPDSSSESGQLYFHGS